MKKNEKSGKNGIVITISGGLLENAEMFEKYSSALLEISKKYEKVVAVTGGGKIARHYISIGKDLGFDAETLDKLGIMVTRIHSRILAKSLKEKAKGNLEVNKDVLCSYEEVVNFVEKNGRCVAVCGGMKPFQSTDKVAADICQMLGFKILIKATKVDGIFDKKPEESGAKIIKELSYEDLRALVKNIEQSPGKYDLFDIKGVDVLEKGKIWMYVVNGKDPKNVVKAVFGKNLGSLVKEKEAVQ